MSKNYTFCLKQTSVDKFKYKCSQIFLFMCILLFALSIYFNVTYSVVPVNGLSMYPTLNDSSNYNSVAHYDKVVLNYIKSYYVGDIIVAKRVESSTENVKYVIKRLIAVGGDKVKVEEDGSIYVNGNLLNEKYNINSKQITYEKFIRLKNSNIKVDGNEIFVNDEMVIPKGYVFYLGDNRSNSYDCSNYGPVKESNVIAKVDFIIKDGESNFSSILKQIFGGRRV